MEREKKKKWRRGRGQEKTEGENQVGGGTIETGHDPLDQMRNKTVNRITHFPIDKMGHHLGEEVSRREGQTEGEGETASVSAIRNKEESGIQMGTEKMEEMNKGLITVTDRDNDDGDPVSIPPSLSISPPSISPLSISTLSSPSPYFQPPLSSFSPVPSLTPPLPPSVELCAVLTDTRLTLDVYHGGTAVLQVLWVSVPGQLRGLQYLRLGSEDRGALEGALEVLPHLTQLRSLAIRGHCFHDAHGDPLPGLLTSLPPSLSSLSLLVHLDLSFNLLSSFPPCLLTLPLLSTLLLGHNHLTDLPPSFSPLPALRYLSLLGNSLASLPPSLGQLKSLHTLDVSYNLLETLPEEIGALEELVKLELSHNRLKRLPETMGCLLSLRDLVIHSNDLRVLPVCLCLDKLDKLKVDVRNNPLGRPPTPPPLPPTPGEYH
ncbi:p53-induced death domain-containing protein 1-like [Salmo trutta]|uniref:p53-induced death domain-containing protein 1-like n=1 Tax=Salmo trutta TaxID=8032 RepID=UPI00112FD431|nr:p53-induced death domain-containing protein 1-like [Salmo trutta]XP_029607742.1 p53-induced death domain-containing protein 1-like [Salmo trutta]XP_029607743.1 p53-induced death domain-containing protein 1-like [Salmo trutta]